MIKVGITGGIGSGKTMICKLFETLRIPIYYADDRAKWLMVNDQELISKLKTLFGEETYFSDGQLNRAHLSNIVFNDPKRLSQLNEVVHPAVFMDGINWHKQHENHPYTIKEAALLFETGSYQLLDYVICVTAPKEIRIQRVMERDQVSREAVESRIDKQWPDAQKIKLADHVIVNDGSQMLIPEVMRIHQLLLKKNELSQ